MENEMIIKKCLAASILAADFSKLRKEIESVEASGIKYLHIDVMDGHFVPNLTFGAKIVADIKNFSKIFLDCHLMVENPEKMISWFLEAGADLITIHIEATEALNNNIEKIKKAGRQAGISVKPGTKIESVLPFLNLVDLVLVMSVEPGFGGQKFLESSLKKISWLADVREKGGFKFSIQVDGGINSDTIESVAKAGADVFVAGSAIFGQKNRKLAIRELYKKIDI